MFLSKLIIPFILELVMGMIKGHPYDEDREKRSKYPLHTWIIIGLVLLLLELGTWTLTVYEKNTKLEIEGKKANSELVRKSEIDKIKLDDLKRKVKVLQDKTDELTKSLNKCKSDKLGKETNLSNLTAQLEKCGEDTSGLDLDDINKRLKGIKNL